ncbi:hypothetical protein NBG4_760013 [Candidatus Sulfobium mesophilum]|uniref:Uncharacterized protein n=1 Tax=Candidatus Sulfobium mesophilum TaxID=2016548 RepID=A0A2U3QKC1_9BACT|nr:hypothetical protein NBG4_760013 [Candidatus Sulfobium mesophilum]
MVIFSSYIIKDLGKILGGLLSPAVCQFHHNDTGALGLNFKAFSTYSAIVYFAFFHWVQQISSRQNPNTQKIHNIFTASYLS